MLGLTPKGSGGIDGHNGLGSFRYMSVVGLFACLPCRNDMNQTKLGVMA